MPFATLALVPHLTFDFSSHCSPRFSMLNFTEDSNFRFHTFTITGNDIQCLRRAFSVGKVQTEQGQGSPNLVFLRGLRSKFNSLLSPALVAYFHEEKQTLLINQIRKFVSWTLIIGQKKR